MKTTTYTGDRRHKPAEQLRSCPVKVRFTDEEFEAFYRGAVMSTDGAVGPFVRECAELGLRMKQQAQDRLMAEISGQQHDVSGAERELMVQAMQDLIRAGIAANAKHQPKAA